MNDNSEIYTIQDPKDPTKTIRLKSITKWIAADDKGFTKLKEIKRELARKDRLKAQQAQS